MKRLSAFVVLIAVCATIWFSVAGATSPVLYRQNAYQSPVHGDPDDLLLLAGYGLSSDDAVVYQIARSDRDLATPPANVSDKPTEESGFAPIVSANNVPYSLTVRLPQELQKDTSYALWVRTKDGEWSKPIRINDARPLWISPAYAYSTGTIGSLPRYLKVIGRNLQPAPGKQTRVKLIGPQTFILPTTVEIAGVASPPSLADFVAHIELPKSLLVGHYKIAVSRDETNWVELEGQTLEVRADLAQRKRFRVDDPHFGGCVANDNQDDAKCIAKAINAARLEGGGTVVFGPGTWDLVNSGDLDLTATEGIAVPSGIDLIGGESGTTKIVRRERWSAAGPTAAFTLYGPNAVHGFTFEDSRRYQAGDWQIGFLQLGPNSERLTAQRIAVGRYVKGINIYGNVFDKTYAAIADGGLPLKELAITHNEFGSFRVSINIAGNQYNTADKFAIDDAVIAFNTFKPGSWLDTKNHQGTMASELGAGHHVDFSDNIADGASADYMYAGDTAVGWRAAFFWHMASNQEMLLVSNNQATCTGDKIGDGEAIAYDNNGNTFAFDTAKETLRATINSITVAGPLQTRQNNRDVPVASYYVGHWIQVGAGPGIGQVRKISGYQIDPANGEVTFRVAPEWDVIPTSEKTKINVGREFWQVYTVGNRIDHRQPLCQKSNRSDPKGGAISIWAQTADSATSNNLQLDTDGILFRTLFSAKDAACSDCYQGTNYINFMEIHDNRIIGEYSSSDGCSSSGIFGSIAAGVGATPLTPGYGISISGNTISSADTKYSGSIAIMPTWYQGPKPNRWPLIDSLLIQHNEISSPTSSPTRACRDIGPRERTGINLSYSYLVWRSTLYANACVNQGKPINQSGSQQTTIVCAKAHAEMCECAR